MSIRGIVASLAAISALSLAALAAENLAGRTPAAPDSRPDAAKTVPGEKSSTDAKAAAPSEAKAGAPSDAKGAAPSDAKAAASSDTRSPREKYAAIAAKNIFYPRRGGASDGEAGSNPGGSGLVLTGVVRAGRRSYAVIQNTATGESSIVAVGEASGAGEITAMTLDGVTLSTEAGTFNVPVGNYLSGGKGPDLPAPPAPATPAPPVAPGAPTAPAAPAATPGAPAAAPAPTATAPAPQGDANSGPTGGRGRKGGRGGGLTQEQRDAMRNMTPEQRTQFFQNMRPTRGTRPQDGGNNQ